MSVDLSTLVAGEKVRATTPEPRAYRHVNPFGPRLLESFERGGEARELPPVPASDVARVCAAIRRAALSVALGSTIVTSSAASGQVVITYWAKVRNVHRDKGASE